MKIDLFFEKISRYDRIAEPFTVGVPFKEGTLYESGISSLSVCDRGEPQPTQTRVTATWTDGSVKWLLVHSQIDLPGNGSKLCELQTDVVPPPPATAIHVAADSLENELIKIKLSPSGKKGVVDGIEWADCTLGADDITGFTLVPRDREEFTTEIGPGGWRVIEDGPIQGVVEARGVHKNSSSESCFDFAVRLFIYAGKPWTRVDYRIINREESKNIEVNSLSFSVTPKGEGKIRTGLSISNYESMIQSDDSGREQYKLIDHDYLINTGNEQSPETLYGTFWADWSSDKGGMSATLFQAQQNFPKSLRVNREGMEIGLIPKEYDDINFIQGVAKRHTLFLHFHDASTTLGEVDARSLQFQLPDLPRLDPDTYRDAGVFLEDCWLEYSDVRALAYLTDLADTRTRGYGILNWGDGPEGGSGFPTANQQENGKILWTNNEYDLPHVSLLMYAALGERRFFDYMKVAAEHWMDVDVCHYSSDRYRYQGQITHSTNHVTGKVLPSHQWVEGLLDYYHVTGDDFALATAIGIGENILRQLERPEFNEPGGTSARETGWALRSLTALSRESGEPRWMEPVYRIVSQFKEWHRTYGAWLAPYTSHTMARVPFMISLAASSLMRYIQVEPDEEVAQLIVDAMRDIIENCTSKDGRFFYKEVPSLSRPGGYLHTLEALTYAYKLSGDTYFLEKGLPSYNYVIRSGMGLQYGFGLFKSEDAVIHPLGLGPKMFACSFLPVASFARAITDAGIVERSNSEDPRYSETSAKS